MVLCVCTANVCRSPAAELLFRTGLRHRLGEQADAVALRSAGTWATPGRPVEPATATALRTHGVSGADLATARSVTLRRDLVASADLVLAAAAEHVRGVWRLQLAARHRTFTLGELARLSEAIDPRLLPDDGPADRLRGLVSAADAIREARHVPGTPFVTEAYDLADPADSDLAQQDMVEETVFAVDALLDLVAGPVAPPDRLAWPGRAVQWRRRRARGGLSL
jgi:low molecular weight protein-tyrosine phosphatase